MPVHAVEAPQFLTGPNAWFRSSGLLAVEKRPAILSAAAAWRPRLQDLLEAADLLKGVVPVAAGEIDDRIAGAKLPLAELMLATAYALTRDCCVNPARGYVIEANRNTLQFFVPCDEPKTAMAAWAIAYAVAEFACLGAAPDRKRAVPLLRKLHQDFQRVARTHSLGSGTLAIARVAFQRDIPWYRVGETGQFVQLGQGRLRRRVVDIATDDASLLGGLLARDRLATISLLDAQGIPTPGTSLEFSAARAAKAAKQLGFPIALIPRAGGRAAAVALSSEAEVVQAFAVIPRHEDGVFVERHLEGDAYRLLVAGGRFIAAAKLVVQGSGRQTMDDATDQVHADTRLLAERVARLVGLDLIGVDFTSPDIGRSWQVTACGVTGLTPTPALGPHAASGAAREIVARTVEALFPDGQSRIPTVGITGSIGKTTTSTMVAAILAEAGWRVARSTTQGAWIGDDKIRDKDQAGGWMAHALVMDPDVEAAVFEFGRGGLVKRGMYLDSIDVAAVLNIHDNHVGIDGVRTREDMASVKRLLVENARNCVVLNADDPLCLAMGEFCSGKEICLVSMKHDNPAVLEHLRAGRPAAYLDERGSSAELKLVEGAKLIGALDAAAIPSSWGGSFRPAIINALSAMAISHAIGIDFAVISKALRKFQSTEETNPGRMNFIENLPYRLLVTWADGHFAIGELAAFARRLQVDGKKRLLLFGVGSRSDAYLNAIARAAAGTFDSYYCCDPIVLSVRAPGETTRFLADALVAAGVRRDCIAAIPSYDKALETACREAQAGDLLVVLDLDHRNVAAVARAIAEGGFPEGRSHAKADLAPG